MKTLMRLIAVLLLLFLPECVSAQEAEEITPACTFTVAGKAAKTAALCDGNYGTKFALRKAGTLEIACTEAMSGLILRCSGTASPCTIEAWYDGDWLQTGESRGHLSEWYGLPRGTKRVRIVNRAKGRLNIAEVNVYGAGDRPAEAPVWEDAEKADFLLVSAHPDDELLWFGGFLPEYAGERGLTVQVLTLVPSTPRRRLELLDGLWHCGVHAYPAFGGLPDARGKSLETQYRHWNRNRVYAIVTAAFRRYRPDVVLSHDVNGEYGHGAHRAAADAVLHAVSLAANSAKFGDSARQYGTWQVHKVYLHLWKEGQIALDWHKPLAAFGGRDGMTVAAEALAFHQSQTKHGWAITEGGQNDNSRFGLAYTDLGPDSGTGDLTEHLPEQSR